MGRIFKQRIFKVVVMRTVTMLWIISMDIVNNSDE